MAGSEMVERVAKAICRSTGRDPDRACSTPFAGRKALEWEWFSDAARAAIEAMREPTDSMSVNGGLELEEQMFAQQGLVFDGAKAVFQRMVDVALAEPTTPR